MIGEKNNDERGWGAFGAFKKSADSHGDSSRSFSIFTTFFVLVAFLGIGYYTYVNVYGAVTIGTVRSTGAHLETGLVGHWTFDGDSIDWSSTTAEILDSGTSGSNGNAIGMSVNASQIGTLNQALYFDGVDDFVSTEYKSALSASEDITYAVWVRPDINDVRGILGALNGENGSAYNFITIDNAGAEMGNPRISIVRNIGGSTLARSVNFPMEAYVWFHITYTYDGEYERIYINGEEQGEWSQTGVFASNSEYGLVLGGSYHSNPLLYRGYMDDVRIYNRTLSVSEISALYRLGTVTKINTSVTKTSSSLESGLVGYWNFDGAGSLSTTSDKSGNGYDGALNGPVPALGKVGQALSFDGVNDYVTTNATIPSAGSISVWVNTTANINSSSLFSIVSGSSVAGNAFRFSFNAFTTYNGWEIYLRGNYGSDAYNHGDKYLTNTHQGWRHLVATWDNTTGSQIYVDGALQSISTTTTNTLSGSMKLNISSQSNGWVGLLDELRLYNRQLTADEIAELYGLGAPGSVKICRESSVQDADGNWYNTIAIGSQCWLDRNMNVGTRVDYAGFANEQSDNGVIEKHCYSNIDSNCTDNNPNKPDGGIYAWNEAMQYSTTEGAQGICPTGFHIPTDAEWYTLEKFLTDSGNACVGARNNESCRPAGTKLQPNGTSGFEANLAGRANSGSFTLRGTYGIYITSTKSTPESLFTTRPRYLGTPLTGGLSVLTSHDTTAYRTSVRCIQD